MEKNGFKVTTVPSDAEIFDYLAKEGCLYKYSPDTLQKINKLVINKGLTLDLGCGDGTLSAALDAQKVIGVEISHACARLAHKKGIPVIIADATYATLPFQSCVFDTVFCIDILHHLERNSWEHLLHEIYRILKAEGQLVMVEPDATNPFVRWTQSPNSPLRVAPSPNEPAIYPNELLSLVEKLQFTYTCFQTYFVGEQVVRTIFPFWQRILKAPFILLLNLLYGKKPNKFVVIAQKICASEQD